MGYFKVLAASTVLFIAASAVPHSFSARDGQPSTYTAYPGQIGRDYDYTGFEQDQTRRAEEVIEMFRFAWHGYYTYAFPNDDLRPVNNTFGNSRNGWGATAIDALDTAIIMEQVDIVNQILDFVPTINFSRTEFGRREGASASVSLFETNIRYIGGLLSAYDLLKGPFDHLPVAKDKVDVLLKQCVSLADALKFAFNTTSGIPVNNIYINNQTFVPRYKMADGTWSSGLAELGTLVLEWQHLSDLTGNPEYGQLAQKAESYFLKPDVEVWPGLTGGNFSVETGKILDAYGGWVSGNDSAYEVCTFSSTEIQILTFTVLDQNVRLRSREVSVVWQTFRRGRRLHNRSSSFFSIIAPGPLNGRRIHWPRSPELL